MKVTAKRCNKETKKEKKEWFDEECKRELHSRRKLRLKMLQEGTEEAKNKLKEQRRKTKMMLRNKKRKHYEKRGLRINEKETKYMEWTEEEYQEGRFLKVETNTRRKYEFEEVEQFTYLRSIFSRKPNIGEEIEARIMAGNKCVAGLRRTLRNKNISRQTKFRQDKTVIRPIVTYASETWALNKTDQIKLEVWDRKILRKIFGGKRTEEGWIRRTNEETTDEICSGTGDETHSFPDATPDSYP
ncbi:hypothetical protein NQ315_014178 [Exocentrus adspersus]|uniref:Uncharacterized protein n=1 Tax=Exocentrus adspersus TaxID=1586481 RepID=A0AAV8VVK7_9CUCU|nr:hypothetical protein NQ315_014178 [Exocentrus adspersus]